MGWTSSMLYSGVWTLSTQVWIQLSPFTAWTSAHLTLQEDSLSGSKVKSPQEGSFSLPLGQFL